MGYDIIGDVHGQAGKLIALLTALGYRKTGGAWRHPGRCAIFVGDFIDRGPHGVETVHLVRAMVDAGSALAVMGNHELNAIAWHTPDERSPGEFLRPHSRAPWGAKNRAQHRAFLAQVEDDPALHADIVSWFEALPLWLDLPGLRVVHACWHDGFIEWLEPLLHNGRYLTPELLVEATTEPEDPTEKDSDTMSVFKAVETLLKGIEIQLPVPHNFVDKDGITRDRIRTRWWDTQASTYRQVALGDEVAAQLPDLSAPAKARSPSVLVKPTFFGHYWMKGAPVVQHERAACVDYSAGSGGPLVAYPLSFLSRYKLRDKLVEALESADPSLTEALQGSGLFLPDQPDELDVLPNARCRDMARTLIDAGLHRLPWIPPALPHHVLGGPFAGIGDAARTKRLLFSSWRMVPRAVSVVVDAAFQQALAAEGVKEAADRHVISGNDDAVAQPCQAWATRFDPLRIADALARDGVKPTPQALAAYVEQELAADVSSLWDKFGDADVHQRDDRWYWMAPLLTDAQSECWRTWSTEEMLNVALGCERSDAALTSAGLSDADDPATRADRRAFAQQVLSGQCRLGRMPDDLARVLSMLALAGPATCLLRATGYPEPVEPAIWFAAGRGSALALLTYLGHPQSVGLLQHLYPAEPAYWRRVLSLCLDGAWQAVIDEYLGCVRRFNIDPPRRFNIDPGMDADSVMVGCGQV